METGTDTKFFVKLDLQHFASKKEDSENVADTDEEVKNKSKDGGSDIAGNGADKGDTKEKSEGKEEGKDDDKVGSSTKGQESEKELEALAKELAMKMMKEEKERIEKEEKEKQEKERQELLQEEGDFETYAKELEAKLAEMEKEVVNSQRVSFLVSEGYTKEQADFLKGSLHGDTPEDFKASLEQFENMFPKKEAVKPADPTLGNGGNSGAKGRPKGEDLGRNIYKKLFG